MYLRILGYELKSFHPIKTPIMNAFLGILRLSIVLLGFCSPLLAQRVSIQSFNYPDHYVRHQNSQGIISRINWVSNDLDLNDGTFTVVRGLDPTCMGCISFESVNYPGHYLRHANYMIILNKNDGSELFNKDASFYRRNGLAAQNYSSYESVNYPNHFIRHQNSQLRISPRENVRLYEMDASFIETVPLKP
jgi:hypothetical protein